MSITIVGLGPGKIDQLTLEAWRVLEGASEVYLRTARHPLYNDLPQGPIYHSFDDQYDSAEDFESLYATIANKIVELGQRPTGVIYAVPGHPLVGENTPLAILKAAEARSISVRIVEGISFIEPSLTLIGLDAIEGLQIFDAIEIGALFHPPINPDRPALVAQVYNRAVASDLKLTLMNQYPDDYVVTLLHAAGTDESIKEILPLYEIDRSEHIAHLTSLYIPPMPEPSSFETLLNVMAQLRAPDGCPWDQEQTHETLRPYLLEEAYEVLEAIDAQDYESLTEELGDVLFHTIFHTQIAVDEGEFYITDVLSKNIAKMIRRHPHIWGTVEVDSPEDVEKNWEAIKRAEQAQKGELGQASRKSALDGVPLGLPALIRASRLQEKAASVGFDWPVVDGVIDKIREELVEIQQAEVDELPHEFGDLLFALVNWIRWKNLDPESLLREANARFYRRFAFIEAEASKINRSLPDLSLEEMDGFWEQGKATGL